jgi:hypothetical protein
MDFKVYTPDGVDSYQGAIYAMDREGAGTLQVQTAEGKRILYGPTGWRRLEEVPAPPPPPPPPRSSAEEEARQELEEARQARAKVDTQLSAARLPRPEAPRDMTADPPPE